MNRPRPLILFMNVVLVDMLLCDHVFVQSVLFWCMGFGEKKKDRRRIRLKNVFLLDNKYPNIHIKPLSVLREFYFIFLKQMEQSCDWFGWAAMFRNVHCHYGIKMLLNKIIRSFIQNIKSFAKYVISKNIKDCQM